MDNQERKCALYRVVHRESGKDYVGISVDPERRWKCHQWEAASGKGYRFHNALRVHGVDAFEWKIMAWASCPDGAKTLEKMAIHLGMGAYNLTKGGDGVHGHAYTAESKARMSRAAKSRGVLPETRRKMAQSLRVTMRGRVPTLDTKAKLSVAAKTRPPISEATRQKMSQSLKAAMKGKTTRPFVSQETRCKISQTMKQVWASRRARG